MASEDFPPKLYVTLDPDIQGKKSYPLANITLDEAVNGSIEPVEVAEYVLTKAFKAQAVVQIIEGKNEGEEP